MEYISGRNDMELIAELLLVCSCLFLYLLLHWHLAAIDKRSEEQHLDLMEKLEEMIRK